MSHCRDLSRCRTSHCQMSMSSTTDVSSLDGRFDHSAYNHLVRSNQWESCVATDSTSPRCARILYANPHLCATQFLPKPLPLQNNSSSLVLNWATQVHCAPRNIVPENGRLSNSRSGLPNTGQIFALEIVAKVLRNASSSHISCMLYKSMIFQAQCPIPPPQHNRGLRFWASSILEETLLKISCCCFFETSC